MYATMLLAFNAANNGFELRACTLSMCERCLALIAFVMYALPPLPTAEVLRPRRPRAGKWSSDQPPDGSSEGGSLQIATRGESEQSWQGRRPEGVITCHCSAARSLTPPPFSAS